MHAPVLSSVIILLKMTNRNYHCILFMLSMQIALKMMCACRHNEKKKKMSKQKDTKPNSDGSISTVLEQDEELGCSESSDDGLRSLLENDDGFVKSDNNETDANEKIDDKGRTSKISSTASLTPRKSIHESLKAMDAPWELRQATALLLQSSLLDESTARLLTSDILDQPMVNNETNKEPGRKERGLVKMKEQETNEEESTQNPGESNAATACGATESSTEELGIQPQTTSTEITANDEEVPSSESSSLLPTPIKNEEMLRPSIFTMHSSHSSLEES